MVSSLYFGEQEGCFKSLFYLVAFYPLTFLNFFEPQYFFFEPQYSLIYKMSSIVLNVCVVMIRIHTHTHTYIYMYILDQL